MIDAIALADTIEWLNDGCPSKGVAAPQTVYGLR
jgi:hypothetical protein